MIFLFAVAFATHSGAAGTAAVSTSGIGARFPADSIKTVEDAERALAEAAKEKKEIAARFESGKRLCQDKFFVTSCVEDARERRRVALLQVRHVEVAADSFKRHARVADREAALRERRLQEVIQEPERAQQRLDVEARSAKKADAAASAESPEKVLERKANQDASARRMMQFEAKQKRELQGQEADAKLRAANTAAYEKKLRNAAAHQREIAEKKARKEREQKARESQASQPK